MADKAWTAETVFDVFGDRLARQILVLARREPQSADDLDAVLDDSLPTIYRRLDTLAAFDLLEEDTRLTDDGNHYTTYETTVSGVSFDVDPDGFAVDSERREGLVDQFDAFWSDLDDATPEMPSDTATRLDGVHRKRPEGDPNMEGQDG